MAAPSERPYDVQIGGYRFRLVPNDVSRQEGHSSDPIRFLAPQLSTTELTYNDVNREAEVPIAQDDFSGGLAPVARFEPASRKMFRFSKNLDTSFPHFVYPAPKVSTLGTALVAKPTIAVQKGDVTYVAAATKLYQITDTITVTLDTTFTNPITDMILFNDKLVVCFGEGGGNLQWRISQTSGAAFTAGDVPAQFLLQAENIIWRAINYQIAKGADVIAGTLWDAYQVGDLAYTITSIRLFAGRLYIGKQDGMWVLGEDGISRSVIPELRLQAYTSIALASQVFDGSLFFNTRHSVIRLEASGKYEYVGLDRYSDPQVPGGGYAPDTLATDGRVLYALHAQHFVPVASQVNGVYIYKLDRRGAWHNVLWRDDLGTAATPSAFLLFTGPKLGVDDFKDPILFAYPSSGNWQLAWAPFSSVDDPLKDTAYRFDNVYLGKLRTLDHVANLPTLLKVTPRITLVSDDIGQSNNVTAFAIEDAQASRKIATFKLDPADEQQIPKPLSWTRLALEFQLQGGSTSDLTLVQKLRGYEFPAVYLARQVRRHVFRLMAVDEQPLATGGQIGPFGQKRWEKTFRGIIDKLRDIRRTKVLVDVEDEDRRQFKAYLVSIDEQTVHPREATNFSPFKAVAVVLNEVEPG